MSSKGKEQGSSKGKGQGKSKEVRPLRPAASLIFTIGTEGVDAHRYLTLVRTSNLSFANSLVFPGGVCEQSDDKHLQSSNFCQYSKITAIRQTLEQTGVLLLPPQSSNLPFPQLQQLKSLYKEHSHAPISYISSLWTSAHLALLKPILRLATPQFKGTSRFDCIFFVVDPSVQRVNLAGDDLQKLEIQESESKMFYWKEPAWYLKEQKEGRLKMAPPQVMLFNVLRNLQEKGETVERLFKDEQLSVEPIMFQFGTNRDVVLPLDCEYKMKEMLEKEPASANGNLIKDYFGKYIGLEKGEGQTRRRIKLQTASDGTRVIFEYTGTQPELTLWKYLSQQGPSL